MFSRRGLSLTLPHRYDFGADADLVGDDLHRPDAWDALRTKTDGAFSIASDREELERKADSQSEIGERMRLVDLWLRGREAEVLVSYGVGGALPELWLLRIDPQRKLVVTDYAPETVARLRKLLPEADVVQHDLAHDLPLNGDAHLFHRIDTELDNGLWRDVFKRFADQSVFLVATQVLHPGDIPQQLLTTFRNRRATNAGWTRTRGAFERLWRETHRGTHMNLGDLEGWGLDPR